MSNGDTNANGDTTLTLIHDRNQERMDDIQASIDSGKHDPAKCVKLLSDMVTMIENMYRRLDKIAKEGGKKMTLNLGPGKSFSFPASEWGKVVIGILVIYIVMRMHGFKPEKMVGMEAQSAGVEQVQSQ